MKYIAIATVRKEYEVEADTKEEAQEKVINLYVEDVCNDNLYFEDPDWEVVEASVTEK